MSSRKLYGMSSFILGTSFSGYTPLSKVELLGEYAGAYGDLMSSLRDFSSSLELKYITESDDEVSSTASLVLRTRLCFCSFSKRRCLFSGKTYLTRADRTLCCRIRLLTSRAALVLSSTNLCSL